MKFEEFFISNSAGKSNCVVRSMCKVLNKEYDEVYNGLIKISEELNCSFNDIEVFETYMERNGITKIKTDSDIKISDLKVDDGTYVVFCYDKKDYYHMVPIINNVIYDKNDECLNLYVISVYKDNIKKMTLSNK